MFRVISGRWVAEQLNSCERLRKHSLYPARSLDLELAITIPKVWSPPERDWAGERLRSRANDPNATLREPGTAAFVLWERACKAAAEVDTRTGQKRVPRVRHRARWQSLHGPGLLYG
ncbi:hypothetical protein [Micromonospora sp. NPDC005113]